MGQVRTLGEIARLIGAVLEGDPSIPIQGVASLEQNVAGTLVLVAEAKYLPRLPASRASAVIAPPGLPISDRPVLRAENPRLAFASALELFYPLPTFPPGISPTAIVAPDARVHPEATIFPFVVIESGAVIEAGVVLSAFVYVGARAHIGEGSRVHPHVTIQADVQVGRRCLIHPGAVLGGDGFGFVFDGTRHRKIPQVGTVVIEDDVEVGANVCIDRATLGETVVGRGTKIDNLVQVAHNVTIGERAILVAQVGIAGSSRVGRDVILGPQCGVVDHVTIGDGCRVSGQSGIVRDIEPGSKLAGTPARPIEEELRIIAALGRLPQLVRSVRTLEKRLEALEARLGNASG